MQLPSFQQSGREGRPAKRSRGESTPADISANALAVMPLGSTHPVIAALDHPLFTFGGKRVAAILLTFRTSNEFASQLP